MSSSSASRMRSARTSRIRALVCEVSVTMPACEPVSEIARWPRSLIAIAHSAHEMRSPVDSSMSISRGSRLGRDLVGVGDQLVGLLAARREHGDDAVALLALGRRSARAARLIRSASATEVPPNFMTIGAWSRQAAVRRDAVRLERAAAGERLAERDLVGVLEVGADRQAARPAA